MKNTLLLIALLVPLQLFAEFVAATASDSAASDALAVQFVLPRL